MKNEIFLDVALNLPNGEVAIFPLNLTQDMTKGNANQRITIDIGKYGKLEVTWIKPPIIEIEEEEDVWEIVIK